MVLISAHSIVGEGVEDISKPIHFVPDTGAVSSSIKRESDEERFLRANSFYQQKRYAQALALYETIKYKGRAVLYNMGNCYYYEQQPHRAVVEWCKARKGATYKEYDASVAACCALKEELSKGSCAGKAIEAVPAFQGMLCKGSFFERIYIPISLFTVQLLFLFFWYTFFLLLFFYKKELSKCSGLFLFCLLCILMSIFFTGVGVMTKYRAAWYPYAVVSVPTASLLSGPHKKYPVLHVLYYMQEGVVAEKKNGWCRLEVHNSIDNSRSCGWIEDTEIEIVE